MSDLPEPLTPADCCLQGYEWMALLGHRLFTSTWYHKAIKDGRGGIAAIKLWWVAMGQVPAGSLPNDEDELALLADFGSDAKGWRKHRPVAMYGWVLCSDNRWYHPVVAEQAMKAFDCQQRARSNREQDAERLRRWRKERGASERSWSEIRAAVFARDGHKCVHCGATDGLHCDHKIPAADGGGSDLDNLITLCIKCHSKKTATQQNPKRAHFETHVETHFKEHFETHDGTPDEMRMTVQDKTEPVQEERKEVYKKPSFIPGTRAREAVGGDLSSLPPDALRAMLDEMDSEKPPRLDRSGDAPPSDDPVVLAHIRKARRAIEMRIPYGETRSVEAQLDALKAQPAVAGSDASMGLKWQPAEPIRTPAQQVALLLGISLEEAQARMPAA